MHNAAFRYLGLDCVYLAFDVDPRNVAQAVSSIRALGLCGINVTIPHKQSGMAGLDEIAPEASMVGAVNTIVNEDGRLKGYNTDVSGVLRALDSELRFVPRDKNVFIVGAGGASRAIIVAMCTGGARSVAVVNRTYLKAQKHGFFPWTAEDRRSLLFCVRKRIPDPRLCLLSSDSQGGCLLQNSPHLPLRVHG